MTDQREMLFPGLAGAGELAGQAVIPVPGVDVETCDTGGCCECGAAGHSCQDCPVFTLDTAPHPSDGCGLCGWDATDDPCTEHRGPVELWNARNGYTPGTEPY